MCLYEKLLKSNSSKNILHSIPLHSSPTVCPRSHTIILIFMASVSTLYLSFTLSLSLSLYIYMYIYIYISFSLWRVHGRWKRNTTSNSLHFTSLYFALLHFTFSQRICGRTCTTPQASHISLEVLKAHSILLR